MIQRRASRTHSGTRWNVAGSQHEGGYHDRAQDKSGALRSPTAHLGVVLKKICEVSLNRDHPAQSEILPGRGGQREKPVQTPGSPTSLEGQCGRGGGEGKTCRGSLQGRGLRGPTGTPTVAAGKGYRRGHATDYSRLAFSRNLLPFHIFGRFLTIIRLIIRLIIAKTFFLDYHGFNFIRI